MKFYRKLKDNLTDMRYQSPENEDDKYNRNQDIRSSPIYKKAHYNFKASRVVVHSTLTST